MTLARVFPRKTNQTPRDPDAFYGEPPDLYTWYDEVDVSVSFTYDIPKAESLAEYWREYAKTVRIGGPAFGKPSGEFIPGKYLKTGITITSRGCPNKCWFCSVHKREPALMELDIKPGYIIQDDNFLACSEKHIRAVFEMLKTQKNRPQFKGGLEAKILKDWHLELMAKVKTKNAFFAYDTKDDLEPLIIAGRKLESHGFTFAGKKIRCFVLVGFPKDTFSAAAKRMEETILAGYWPLAMQWRNKKGERDKDWQDFSRYWARPPLYFREAQKLRKENKL